MVNALKCLIVAQVAACASLAGAQYPERPIRIIIPFVAGGVSDTQSRLLAQKITEQTGKVMVVENRSGAGGRIGYEAGARAAPDGYTLVATDATYTMMPGIYGKLGWEHSDLTPVALMSQMAFVVAVNSGGGVSALQDFIGQAKKNPMKFNYGSAGNGSVNHLVTELFRRTAGVELTHVPYKGMGDAVVGLMGNQVDILVTALPTGIGHVRSGKMTALAVTSAKRSTVLPNVPTTSESGVPIVANNWVGFTVPRGAPPEAYEWLQKSVAAALAVQEVKDRIVAQGAEPTLLHREDFGRMMQSETQRWTEVIRAAGIKAD